MATKTIKKPTTSNLTPDEELYLKAKDIYYSGKDSIMSDADFDILEDKLRNEDSFVIEIVGTSKKGPKLDVPHPTPMLSLDKVKFKKNYVPYEEACHKLYSKHKGKIIYEPKLDGNAITINYENGNLISIASRGTGVLGQNYTEKLKSKVPTKIKDFTGEIRGECVIDVEIFNQKYSTEYKNARNFVAGILSSDIDKTVLEKLKDIDFVAFDVKGLELEEPSKWLASKGFETLDFVLLFTSDTISEEGFIDVYKKFENYRKTCKYQLDGIVAKFIDPKIREELGETGHHPNWALAIKFVADEVETPIIGIELGMSKRGELAPVAILKPVELMGSTVQRASLFNASWMIANKCYPGAIVTLVKSGDIIPIITGIIKPSEEEYELPTEWHGHKVTYNGVNLMVEGFENTEEYKAIKMNTAITALGFKGIGPATSELLSQLNLLDIMAQSPESLRMMLLNTGNFKDGRELEVIIEAFFSLTEVELWQVIYSFGNRNCGKTISKELAKWLLKIDHSFKGLEKVVVEAFINDDARIKEVNDFVSILENNNIRVIKPAKTAEGSITYECTGSPDSHGFPTKSHFDTEAMKYGAIHTALKSGTDYLVTDSTVSMTGKMQKATKLGVKIVTYTELIEILKNK